MQFWKITQGNSRCKVHAPDYAGALARGAQIGFKAPDSVVLDDAPTHLEQSKRARNATPCTAANMTLEGRCMACGWRSPQFRAA